MRKINFRVWNTLLKNYLPDDSVCILPNGDIVLYNLAAMIAAYKRPSDMLEGENIVEQSTNLKDKNGTEIYEGDILIDDTGEPIEYWVVKFSDGGFVGECAGVAEPLFELTNLEVVGNIHEDSELVEEK
nr:MAG TPA: YopX protein [Caudoviricetes sp.]